MANHARWQRGTLVGSLLAALTCTAAHADEPAPTPAATPAVTPATAPAPAQADEAAELDRLTREVESVLDELVAARVRADVLTQNLFQSQISVSLVRRAPAQRLTRITLELDGVRVHVSDGRALGRERAQLFSGYVTPGMHELTLELEESSAASGAFGYTRSEHYRVEVKKQQRTELELIVHDDSDMAEQAREGDEGAYRVETELRVSYRRSRAR